jgi:DNA processing protein
MTGESSSPCRECLSRRWLIGELSALLDYHRGRPEQLIELLGLDSHDLIEALAGRRRSELTEALSRPRPRQTPADGTLECCRHQPGYPLRASALPAAPLLALRSRSWRMSGILSAPAVAFVGCGSPSSYGMQMTASFARGLSAAGVTVVGGIDGQLGRFALEGAMRTGRAGALGVCSQGLDVPRGGSSRGFAQELCEQGCLLSEQPHRARGRSWGALAAERLVVALADVVVLVEARAGTAEMLGAKLAGRLGRPLAALPGTLTNPLASGPIHALSRGARLLRGPADILDMLHLDIPEDQLSGGHDLPPGQARVLEQVGAGLDTFSALASEAGSTRSLLAALGELQAAGLLLQLPDGRYQAVEPAVALERTRRRQGPGRPDASGS